MRGLTQASGVESLASCVICATIAASGSKDVKVVNLVSGHGIIITDKTDSLVVEQARGKRWFRKFRPWVSKAGQDLDPHGDLGEGQTCQDCNFKKK